MTSPGIIATEMFRVRRELETTLHTIALALGLAPYEAPQVKHYDHNYVEMAHMRALSAWLRQAAAQLDEALEDTAGALDAAEAALAQASALRATLEQALALLTKDKLIELGGSLGVEGLSDGQRKDELIATLIAATMASETGAIWRTPEEFAAMQRVDASDADESDSPDSDEPEPPDPDASDNGYQMESSD